MLSMQRDDLCSVCREMILHTVYIVYTAPDYSFNNK